MNLTDKNLKILEALFREGNDFMHSHYPKYTPRKQDEGYFELAVRARITDHESLFTKWHRKVVRTLVKSIQNDFYASRFERTARPNTYTLLAPDGFYWGLKELERTILELRKVYFADRKVALDDRTKKVTAHFSYNEPSLLLIIDDSDEKFLIHRFRKGAPKDIIESALRNASKRALTSHFRSGSRIIKQSFTDVFRQFLEDEKFKTAKIEYFMTVSSSSVHINEQSFVMTKTEARKIAQAFKKFG